MTLQGVDPVGVVFVFGTLLDQPQSQELPRKAVHWPQWPPVRVPTVSPCRVCVALRLHMHSQKHCIQLFPPHKKV